MGEEGLSDHQRRVILAERVIKEGFLQQSAFSAKDRYASPQKQAMLLQVVMQQVQLLLNDIGSVSDLRERLQLDRLIRLKDEVGSDEAQNVLTWLDS